MAQALLVTCAGKSGESLKTLIKAFGYGEIAMAKSGGEARRNLAQNDYDIVVVNAPLQDESGFDVSIIAAQVTTAGVVLIVKSEVLDEVIHKTALHGVLTIGKPVTRQMLWSAVKLADASRTRLLKLKKENEKLTDKIKEIKLVDKAKYLLMQTRNITEDEAHHFIEKEAMNNRCARSIIARRILGEYFENTEEF